MSNRGPTDPIAQQATALIQALDTNPNAISDPTYQDALDRIGDALAQAHAGRNVDALAREAAGFVSDAVNQLRQTATKRDELIRQILGGAPRNRAFSDSTTTPAFNMQPEAAAQPPPAGPMMHGNQSQRARDQPGHGSATPLISGCQITRIDGTTPSTTVKYRFTFEFTCEGQH